MSDGADTDSTARREVVVRDGRVLEVITAGPPDGVAVVFHHGTPFSAVPYRPASDGVRARDAHLVSWARPGYAGSRRRPGRAVADVAQDAAQVLDALGQMAAAIIGGVAPYGAAGLDWTDGMGPENVEEFAVAAEGGKRFSEFLTREAAQFSALSAEEVAESLGGLVSDVDKAALTGEFADLLARSLAAGVSSGTDGWHDDDVAFLSDWGFDLAAISRPVAVWQGREDRMVPYAHGVWLAAHVPTARPHLLADEGHVSLCVAAFDYILDDLLALSRLAG